MEQVIFTSRGEAEAQPAKPNWAVISISDAGHGPANLQPGWFDVLRLDFYDREMPTIGLNLFTLEQARTIVEFVKAVAPQVDGILVHCFAGISRSAAVAKYIACTHGLPFPADYAYQNRLVFRLLNEAHSLSLHD